MTTKAMDVFSMRDTVVGEYGRFATSFTTIHARDIDDQVRGFYAGSRYWPEPLLQLNPQYIKGLSVPELVQKGVLVPETEQIFRTAAGPLHLHKHQQQAIGLAADGESYVVTTGTGSGKSMCFFIPIVSAIIADKKKGGAPRTRAIIIYPMNALANSQLEEIEKFVKNVPGEKPITYARYTGQENADERRAIADHPPDILLTNFMMLELLMTRQDELDRRVISNCAGLRFLVLDELHTYRGRQGADVALLVRRVRERLAPDHLQCIATSATMANEGTQEHKNRVVAGVASKLFAVEIPPGNIIVGYTGPPFRWDPERRFLLRCELDAAFFHLYGLSRDDTDYVMETFPIVKRHDERDHGEFRTKRVILEMYDAMAESQRTGTAYQTRLDPPPADPRVAHPESTRPPWAKKPS